MSRATGFENVEAIGRTLPDVELATAWGQPALKVRGRMFACLASHKSAEPDTLVVRMDFANRDALIDEEPGTYYIKEHYIGYPCVLVRLSRVLPDALRELVIGAHRFVSAEIPNKPIPPRRRTRNPRAR
ncbi:MAG: MmcQ/YjbR family DNA-binding protein [Bryobacteraceae bacterium]